MSEKKKEEKIIRTFRTIVIKIDDKEEGVIDMLIPMSTISTDRHGESIDPKGWKKYLKAFMKRAPLVSSHNYNGLQNQIGELLDLQITEKGLLARPKYYINQGNPEADWGYFLATKGMAAYSVGFIPVKWVDSKDEPRRTYTEQELIEISHVIVPSNRDAIQEYKQKAEYEKEDPIVKEVIEEVLKNKEAVNFYDSRLIMPYGAARKLLFEMADTITVKQEGAIFKKLEGKPGETEEEKAANEELVKAIITEAFKEGVEIEDIDVEKVKASMEKDEKEDEGILIEGKIGYSLNDIYDIVKENKELKAANELWIQKYVDIELKAGAVLNAKNKSNLKNAQAMIQSVLDSAEAEESFTVDEYYAKWKKALAKEEDDKKDDTVITITDDKKEDPPKDEEKEEKTITVDAEIISKAVKKAMNYTLGIVDK